MHFVETKKFGNNKFKYFLSFFLNLIEQTWNLFRFRQMFQLYYGENIIQLWDNDTLVDQHASGEYAIDCTKY